MDREARGGGTEVGTEAGGAEREGEKWRERASGRESLQKHCNSVESTQEITLRESGDCPTVNMRKCHPKTPKAGRLQNELRKRSTPGI